MILGYQTKCGKLIQEYYKSCPYDGCCKRPAILTFLRVIKSIVSSGNGKGGKK